MGKHCARLLGNCTGIAGTGLALLGVNLLVLGQYAAALFAVVAGASIAYMGHRLVVASSAYDSDDTQGQGLFDER